MATIDDLLSEEDLLVNIFSHYIRSEGLMQFLRNIPRVCKAWNDISSRPALWRDVRTNDWNFLLNISGRGLLHNTQNLKIDNYQERSSIINLPAVLKNIRHLKSLDMNGANVSGNSIRLVTEHCPHLERLCLAIMKLTSSHEWDQFLTVCGPTLKDLDLSYRCSEETEQQMVSGIAAKCPLLERLRFFTDLAPFPIYELRSRCPWLKELKIYGCDIITDERNDYSGSGFKELKKFSATGSDFGKLDLYEVLKDSTHLEALELLYNKDLVSSNISKIPSERVRILDIGLEHEDVKALGDAVCKWRRTLTVLNLTNCKGDISCVLHNLLHDNPNPQLEKLVVYGDIDLKFFGKIIEKCRNLTHLRINSKEYKGREKIEGAMELFTEDV